MTADECETCSGSGTRGRRPCDDCRGTKSEAMARHYLYGDPKPGGVAEHDVDGEPVDEAVDR